MFHVCVSSLARLAKDHTSRSSTPSIRCNDEHLSESIDFCKVDLEVVKRV